MKTFYRFLLFSFPYIRKYWLRFTIGLVLGFFYGFSNGVTLGSVSILLQRLTLPQHVQSITDAGIDAAKQQKSSKKPDNQWKTLGTRVQQDFYVIIDPWLPLQNRALDWRQCFGLFMLFPALAFVRGMLGYASTYLLAWVGQRMTNDVKLATFHQLCSQSPEFFNRTPTVVLLTNLENNTSSLRTFLLLGLTDLCQQPFTVVSLFVAMFYIDPSLTIVALIFVPLFIIPTQAVARKIKKMGKMDNVMLVAQSSVAAETFNNIRITKAYCLEEAHAKVFHKSGQKMGYFAMKLLQSREMLGPILESLTMVGVSAIFLYVVITHRSIDTLGTFLFAMIMFFAPIKRLSSLNVYFITLNVAAEQLMDIFDLKPSVPEAANPIPFKSFQREIGLKNVSLAYNSSPVLTDKQKIEKEERKLLQAKSNKPKKIELGWDGKPIDDDEEPILVPVLNKLTFTLTKGRRLGLAGESGAGKSSLLLLLMRFWDPTEGSIELDGIDIKDMSFKDLRTQIAYVTQEVQLFDTTIAENIKYGRMDASRDEIIRAAKQAHAHDFIQSLPKGYDTQVGERGVILSGGQRQRVAIARAFVRNAPILILDEATASLDSQSEAEVQKAIDDLAENRTVICVAHRLSTLKNMDEILVLRRGGDIAEKGSFKELLERGGLFTRMAAAQSIFASDAQTEAKDPATAIEPVGGVPSPANSAPA